jgi:hypothetical protein
MEMLYSLHRKLKQKYLFIQNGGQEGKTGPIWGLVPVVGGRI